MNLFSVLIIVCFTIETITCNFFETIVSQQFVNSYASNDVNTKEWWEISSFYQIYPRSFKDSNGDGIGDLRGVIEKLPYLKELGINATWLSPIFKSPMADFGYDISNFFEIQPEYGTMEDFEELVKRAHELNIRIILDFVPNHSSDENEWFIKSERREDMYEHFYMWHPGYIDPKNSTTRLPPSNWLSYFRGSAWQWSDKRQEFYLHQFLRKQPDLNYRNPIVVATMKQVLWFWLEKGVDGFRCDALPALFELKPGDNGKYKDEPKSGWTNDTDDQSYLIHKYTQNQPETLDMVYQWRNLLDTFQELHGGERRILMTESFAPIDFEMKYYGDGAGRDGAEIPFNFYFIVNLNKASNGKNVKKTIDIWMKNIPKGRTPNWVIGNHDNARVGSRYGEQRIDGIAMIELTLPGISITYNGEEIGMTDLWISWNDTVDPAACNSNPQIYEKFTRDPERTPFQWDDTTSAGFSTSTKTWLPVSPKYKDVNVKIQNQVDNSHLKIYKNLFALRQTKTLQYGDYESVVVNKRVVIIKRELQEHEAYISVVNWNDGTETVNLKHIWNQLPDQLFYHIVSVGSKKNLGDQVSSNKIILQPYEAFILKTNAIKYFDNYLDFMK